MPHVLCCLRDSVTRSWCSGMRRLKCNRYIIAEYPNSKQAEVAQLVLGHAHRSAGNYVKAIEAYDVIREGGVGRYPPHVVIEGILHMAENNNHA